MKSIKPTQAYIDQDRAKALLEKWTPVLDYSSDNVSAIEDDHTRLNTAMLLENQEAWCLNEANNVSGGTGSVLSNGGVNIGAQGNQIPNSYTQGDTYATGDYRLPKILIPMIRRTFPELITNEIVGVQPMSGPVGLAFALRYKYDTDALGNGVDGIGQGTYGTASDTAANPAPGAGGGPASGSGTNVDGNELGYQMLDTRFTGTSSGKLSGLGGVATDFPGADQDSGVAKLLANFELTGRIPQVLVSFEKTAVEAGTRRLAARWSVELEQDLKNMNGIDIDTELTNAMSYELQAEIDREMLMRMIQVALDNGTGNGYSIWAPQSADGRWLVERNRDFYQRLIIQANRIAIRNRRGAANFIVATPRAAAILEMLPEFQWVPVQGNVNTQPVGVAKVGNLGGRFNVYRDTRTEAQFEQNQGYISQPDQGTYTPFTSVTNQVRATRVEYTLLGYKGPEFYDTGIIYCPYIPVMVQRTIGPNDFSPRVGLLTRYGVVDNIFGANLYYHVVILKNLGDAFTPGSQAVYF
jgi:hypothetical protein